MNKKICGTYNFPMCMQIKIQPFYILCIIEIGIFGINFRLLVFFFNICFCNFSLHGWIDCMKSIKYSRSRVNFVSFNFCVDFFVFFLFWIAGMCCIEKLSSQWMTLGINSTFWRNIGEPFDFLQITRFYFPSEMFSPLYWARTDCFRSYNRKKSHLLLFKSF